MSDHTNIHIRGAHFKVASTPRYQGFWTELMSGQWEPGTFDTLDRLVTPETTYLDMGTWIGPTVLYAATKAKRVIGFEVDPVAIKEISANLALNPALASKVQLVEKAVSATAGEIEFSAATEQGDSMSSALIKSTGKTWRVATITPNEIIAMLPATGHVMVKIDIEGGEYGLLPALKPLIDRPNTDFFIAFHPKIYARRHQVFKFRKAKKMVETLFSNFTAEHFWKPVRLSHRFKRQLYQLYKIKGDVLFLSTSR